MPPPEHLHIITAGTDIFPAYVRALRDHDDISGTIVVADQQFYAFSSREDKAVQAARERTRNAVAKVRAHAAALKIPVSFAFVNPPIMESARDALYKILEEYPGARLTFDLSGGPKDLCMVLFSLSLFIGAKTRYSLPGPDGREERAEFGVPGIPVATVAANRNYLRILESLARRPEKTRDDPVTGLSRPYLYNQVAAYYVPKRTRGVKRGAAQPGGTIVQHELSQGTFSNILRTMAAGGLIEECPGPDAGRKRSLYRITEAGRLALRLAQIQSGHPRVT
jgi:DNA-binding MarR family transcriptional regulator